MEKVSVPIANHFCPQTLFLYGTYKEDNQPNFGLFCWFSYCWDNELGVIACIGGEKLTKDRINATNVFSANLVTEPMLPLADYFGNKNGYDSTKMAIEFELGEGQVLKVPTIKSSPWVYELEVQQVIPLNGSEIYICKIRNVIADKVLLDKSKSVFEHLQYVNPVVTTHYTYLSLFSKELGNWGIPQESIKK